MYTVTVTLCQNQITQKLVAATNALDACNLVERLMLHPSQAEQVRVERIRTEYRLVDLWFEYEARKGTPNATLTAIQIEAQKHEDIDVIRQVLTERGESLTLENARFVLCIGLLNRPEAWTMTLEELPGLWAVVEMQTAPRGA